MQNNENLTSQIKKLPKIGYYYLIGFGFLYLFFRDSFHHYVFLSIVSLILLDILIDFIAGFGGVFKEHLYLSYAKYYRRLIFYFLVIIEIPLISQAFSFSARKLSGDLIILAYSVILLMFVGRSNKEYSKFYMDKLKNTRYIGCIDSILLLSFLFFSFPMISYTVLAGLLFSIISLLIQIFFGIKRHPLKMRVTLFFVFTILFLGALLIDAYWLNIYLWKIAIFYVWFFLLKIFVWKFPMVFFTYSEKEIEKINFDYWEEYPHLSFVISPEEFSSIKEYNENIRKTLPEKGKTRYLFRIDNENVGNLLPLLNIPEPIKEEISRLITENPDNIILISEIAFTTKWRFSEKYLVFEVKQEDRLFPKSKMRRVIRKAKYRYAYYKNHMDLRLLSRYHKEIDEYRKKIRNLPIMKESKEIFVINKENLYELLPALYVPGEIKKEIEEVVKQNKIVLLSEGVSQSEWRWENRYVVLDPKMIYGKEKRIPFISWNITQGKRIFLMLFFLFLTIIFALLYLGTFEKETNFSGPTKIDVDTGRNVYVFINKKIYKFDEEGNEIFWIGKAGKENGIFDAYIDFAVGEGGEIYVADSKTKRIFIYKENGELLGSFGGEGTSIGKFNSIIKIAVGTNGNIYALDMYNHRVQAFDLLGHFKWKVKLEPNFIYDEITVNKLGEICVVDADPKNRKVIIINPETRRINAITFPNIHFHFYGAVIKVDTSNNYLIADYFFPYLWKIDNKGRKTKVYPDLIYSHIKGISDFTVDKNDNIWIADEQTFKIFTLSPSGIISTFNKGNLGYILEKNRVGWNDIMRLRKRYFYLILLFILITLFVFLTRGSRQK